MIGNGDTVTLSEDEAHCYMYYPFCLYTGGVVGHTFDSYTLMAFVDKEAIMFDYLAVKKAVEHIENAMGAQSWLAPRVKTLNVAVSRVTMGNTTNIIEINEGKKLFWKETVMTSDWHMSQSLIQSDSDKIVGSWRSVIVEAMQLVILY
jgi:hypothetical protein